jgi:hypothetical protein
MKAILLTLFLIACTIAQGQTYRPDTLKAKRDVYQKAFEPVRFDSIYMLNSSFRHGEGPWLGGSYGVTFWQDGRIEVTGDTLQVLRLMWERYQQVSEQHEAARDILRLVGNNGWVDNPKAFDAAVKRYKLLMNPPKKKN